MDFLLAFGGVEGLEDVEEGAEEDFAVGGEKDPAGGELELGDGHGCVGARVLWRARQPLATCLRT